MAVTTGFQGRTFDVPRTCVPCIDPPRRAPCAAADAVFADAKAFLSSSEARQMSESELERELHRRGQELVRKLLQGHRDQRSPKEAAGPAEGKGTSGVECSEPREHESHAETASGTMQVVGLGCARRGHDGLHRLDAALNLLPERYWVEMRRRVTIATASRAPPRTPWKPPWYSTSSTWQRRRGVRCSSPAHRRACLRIPGQTDHRFRPKPITDSDPNRSPIPVETDHPESGLSDAGQPRRRGILPAFAGGIEAGEQEVVHAEDSRGAAAVLRRGVEHPGDCPQPGDVAVDGGRVPAPRQGGGGELAGTRGDRRRRAGAPAVSGAPVEPHVASAAGVERGAPGAAGQERNAGLALGRVQGDPSRGVAVQPVLRAVPGMGWKARPGDAPGAPRRREAVHRLRRADGAGGRPRDRRGASSAGLRGRARRLELHLRRGHLDADPAGLDGLARTSLRVLRRLSRARDPRQPALGSQRRPSLRA